MLPVLVPILTSFDAIFERQAVAPKPRVGYKPRCWSAPQTVVITPKESLVDALKKLPKDLHLFGSGNYGIIGYQRMVEGIGCTSK